LRHAVSRGVLSLASGRRLAKPGACL
jgi:hypothetical protein